MSQESAPLQRTLVFGNVKVVVPTLNAVPADYAIRSSVKVDAPFADILVCYFENTSATESVTLAVEESLDDGSFDPFTSVPARHAGANVATVTVPSYGSTVFTLEAITKKYLQFTATPTNNVTPYCRVVIASWLSATELYAKAFDPVNHPLT